MNVTSVADISKAIADRRKALGWTQLALAERLGVSRAWVVALEGGKSTLRADMLLQALAMVGGVVEVKGRLNSKPGSTEILLYHPRTGEFLGKFSPSITKAAPPKINSLRASVTAYGK